MKLFDVLAKGWQALDEDSKARILGEITPSTVVKDILLKLDRLHSSHAPANPEATIEDDLGDEIIDAEYIDLKDGFGA